jgi:hypothetical protein
MFKGWTGQDCDRSVDDCIGNGCRNGGTCIDGYMSYTCRCPKGFVGKVHFWHHVYSIKFIICNGQNLTEDFSNLDFDQKDDHIYFFWLSMLNRLLLVLSHLSKIFVIGSRCEQDINECSESPCNNNGTCNNYNGGFNCTCPVQWTGLDCTEEVDFCEDNLCQNSACVALETTYSCSCNSGWTGQFCNVNINECQNNPCQNNATCVDNAGSFTCTCIEGFHGLL